MELCLFVFATFESDLFELLTIGFRNILVISDSCLSKSVLPIDIKSCWVIIHKHSYLIRNLVKPLLKAVKWLYLVFGLISWKFLLLPLLKYLPRYLCTDPKLCSTLCTHKDEKLPMNMFAMRSKHPLNEIRSIKEPSSKSSTSFVYVFKHA